MRFRPVLLFLLAVSLSACGPAPTPPPPVAAPPEIVVPDVEVEFNKLGWQQNRYTLDGQPYSGRAVAHHPNGAKKAVYEIYQGRYHGWVREWYENGQAMTETAYRLGQHHGRNTYWNADGTVQVVKEWVDDQLVKETPGGK
jgi:hypothetical protein